jgi:transposase-like protein
MAGKKGMKHYPLAMKLEAVRLHQEEGKSYQEITKLLGIADRKRVEKWLREYRTKGQAAFGRGPGQKKRGRPPKRENTEAYIARLEMENDLLKKFHAELRKLELAKRNIGSSTTKENDTK